MTDQQLSPAAQAFAESADAAEARLYSEAVALVRREGRCSTSWLQRQLSVGYARALRLVERMEAAGVVSPADPLGKREVFGAGGDTGRAHDPAPAPATPTATERAMRAGRPPMRETDADRQVKNVLFEGTADELRQFIERYERIEADKKDLSADQKEVMAEAKGRGYDAKVIRRIIALRKREAEDVAEEEAILDLYKSALGMA